MYQKYQPYRFKQMNREIENREYRTNKVKPQV